MANTIPLLLVGAGALYLLTRSKKTISDKEVEESPDESAEKIKPELSLEILNNCSKIKDIGEGLGRHSIYYLEKSFPNKSEASLDEMFKYMVSGKCLSPWSSKKPSSIANALVGSLIGHEVLDYKCLKHYNLTNDGYNIGNKEYWDMALFNSEKDKIKSWILSSGYSVDELEQAERIYEYAGEYPYIFNFGIKIEDGCNRIVIDPKITKKDNILFVINGLFNKTLENADDIWEFMMEQIGGEKCVSPFSGEQAVNEVNAFLGLKIGYNILAWMLLEGDDHSDKEKIYELFDDQPSDKATIFQEHYGKIVQWAEDAGLTEEDVVMMDKLIEENGFYEVV